MTNLNSGDLRHRAVVQRRSAKTGSRGELIEEWHDIGRMYCKITPLWGQELEVARRRQENVTIRVITRAQKYRNIGSDCRIVHRGQVYHVGFIQEGNDERLEDIHLMCSRNSEPEV